MGRARHLVLLALAVLLALPAAGSAQSTPRPLWDEFPLEDRAQPVPVTPTTPVADRRTPPAAADRGDGPPLAALIAAGAVVPAVLAAVLARRARRRRQLAPERFFAVETAAPRRPAGPTCQIRWLSGAGRFAAVRVDGVGQGRSLALSPTVAGAGDGPPEQSREAQSALRALARDLRALGWRPLRTRGRDLGAVRWYARRFTLVAAEEEGREAA